MTPGGVNGILRIEGVRQVYRVFLVDDDDLERRGIRALQLFEQLELTIVGEAWNGELALQQMHALRPDIVLSDVRMPVMDGLRMAAALRRELPGVKLIMMSGYEDFDAVRQSIQVGAEAFLTKPLRIDELKHTLSQVLDALDAERNRTRRRETVARYVARLMPMLRERLLRDLMLGVRHLDGGETQRELEEIGLFQDVDQFCVFAVQLSGPGEAQAGALDALKEVEGQHEAIPVAIQGGLYALMVILPRGLNDEALFDSLQQRANAILTQLRALKASVTLGISGVGSVPGQLGQLYRQACAALQKQALYSANRVYWYDSQEEGRALPDAVACARQMDRALAQNDEQAVCGVITQFYGAMSAAGAQLETAHALSLEMLFHFVILAHQDGKDFLSVFDGREMPYQSIAAQRDLEGLARWMRQLFLKVLPALYLRPRSQAEKLVGQVREIIETQYAGDISADAIARQLFVAPSHLRRVFKNLTGQTIQECILATRMNRARALLFDPSEKVFEVAQAVGYDNHSYFSIVFKKYFGVTPGEYRNAIT